MSSSPQDIDSLNKSKRPRVSAACTICRKRKVKCDKTRPTCLVCVKHNVAHLCEYVEPNWAANRANKSSEIVSPSDSALLHANSRESINELPASVDSTIPPPRAIRPVPRQASSSTINNSSSSEDQSKLIEQLQKKVKELEYELRQFKSERIEKEYTREDETISMRPAKLKFITELSSVLSVGVLSAKVFSFIDPLINFLRSTIPDSSLSNLPLEILNMKPVDGTGKENRIVDSQFRKKILEYVSLLASKDNGMKKSDKADFGKSMAPIPIRFGGVGQSYEEDLRIIRFIEERLPSEKAAWLLMDRFFLYVYPFFPYINQDKFYEKVCLIIGQRSDKLTPIKLTVERRHSLINVSLFLLVIHLGSLTLYDCTKCPIPEAATDPDVKFLIENPICPKMIVLSQLATKAFHTLAGKSFTLLRVALYLKIAEQLSPDQAEQLELQSTSGFCFELMVELGMNRDPISSPEFASCDKSMNLFRKVWHGVRCDDFFPSFLVDNYFIRMVDSTTQLPQYLGRSVSGNFDLDIEQATISGLIERTSFDEIYRNIAKISMDLRRDPYVKDILELIVSLEELRDAKLQPIEELLTLTSASETFPQRLRKALRFVQYLESGTMLNCLYYHLFLFYENKSKPSLAFKYFKKCTSGVSTLGHFCSLLLTNQKLYFGSGIDYYVTPNILYATDALHMLYFSLTLRTKHYYYLKKINGEMTFEIEEIHSSFVAVIAHEFKSKGKMFAKVNHYYYNAWRYNKIEGYRYQKISQFVRNQFDVNKPKNELMPTSSSNIFFKWSPDMFHELLDILSGDELKQPGMTRTTRTISTEKDNTSLIGTPPPDLALEPPIQSSLDNTWLSKMVDSKMNSMMVNNKDIDFWTSSNGKNVQPSHYHPSVDSNNPSHTPLSGHISDASTIQLPNMDTFSLSPGLMDDADWNNDLKFNQLFDDLNDTLRNSMINEFQIQ